MRPDLIWLLFSTCLFGGAICWEAAKIRSGRPESFSGNLMLMASGFVSQTVFLFLRGREMGSCPITQPAEILVFVAWSAVALYFLVGQPFRLSLLGTFTAPLAVLFQLTALPRLQPPVAHPSESDFWLQLHASISLVAYGAFALACAAGVMFLLQDRLLRTGHLEGLSFRLPPVTNLTHSIVRLVGAGLLLLSLGIVCSFGMRKPPSHLHLMLSGVVWLVYAVLWGWRRWGMLPNSRMAWCAIGSFMLPVVTLGLLEH